MIEIPRAIVLKYKHPVWPWDMCLREAKRDLVDVNWNQVWYGLIVVTLLLFLLSQVFRQDEKDWVCARAEFAGVWINDKLYQAAPCLEEINLKTAKTRKVER